MAKNRVPKGVDQYASVAGERRLPWEIRQICANKGVTVIGLLLIMDRSDLVDCLKTSTQVRIVIDYLEHTLGYSPYGEGSDYNHRLCAIFKTPSAFPIGFLQLNGTIDQRERQLLEKAGCKTLSEVAKTLESSLRSVLSASTYDALDKVLRELRVDA